MTYRFETLQQHAGQHPDSETGARAVPIYQTTSFVFNDTDQAEGRFALTDSGGIYGRLTNPTWSVLEERIAALEGGTSGLVVSSGSAAITYSILNLAGARDEIVAASSLYGGTYNLLNETLPTYGITTRFVNPDKPEEFDKAINDKTKAVLIESLGNPSINIIDIEKVVEIAHSHGVPVLVDNTFATPYLFRPFEYGADIVIHSATKFIGGHGTTLGGLIIENGEFDWEASGRFPEFTSPDETYHGINFGKDLPGAGFTTRIRAKLLRDTGACISPFNAWLLIQGTETLSLRVERHVENTQKIVEYLDNHDKVTKINYPGLKSSPYYELGQKYFPKGAGSIFTFEVEGGEENARKLIDNLQIFSQLANVADSKSLVIHPASTTHSQLKGEDLTATGTTPSQIRLSIGIENVDDLIEDLDQALATI